MNCTANAGRAANALLAVLAACSAAHAPPDAATVRCTSSGECYGAVPYCDPALGVCVPCRRNEECSNSLSGIPQYACDPGSGECVQCVSDAACSAGIGERPLCAPTLHVCAVACDSDVDCVREFVSGICPASLGYCVRCLTGPYCDPELHYPVECVTDEHCSPEEPICHARHCTTTCDPRGACAEGRHCERRSMLCVECTMNAHCPETFCTSEFRCFPGL